MASADFERHLRERIERELGILRAEPTDRLARKRLQILSNVLDGLIDKRGFWKRRGDGSMPALVEPPRGPKPFAGGAAARLEFD